MTTRAYQDSEVMFEFAEVCLEILVDLRQQLSYYRVSAYKHESVKRLHGSIEQMRALVSVLNYDTLNEILADFDASEEMAMPPAPGECLLTSRLLKFMASAEPVLKEFQKRVSQRRRLVSDDVRQRIQSHRSILFSVCRQGSRSWEILRSLC